MAATEAGARAVRSIEDLYRQHVGAVYRYAYAVLGNHADAEDVTQTTFVNALRAMERGETPQKPENWLLTIAHNIVRQRWRQLQSRPAEVELEEGSTHAAHEADETTPAMADVVRALQRIPTSQRSALVMRELEGRSYQEIGEILGLTTSALETLLFRARRSLAEELEHLVTCDRAEMAISQQLDGRLSRKERKRLQAHIAECPACARMAKTQERYRGALKGLALLPLPASLTLFKGTSSASAAGLPTIGLATGAHTAGVGGVGVGVGGATAAGSATGGTVLGGIAAKIAAVVAAAAVVGGGAYTGVTVIGGDDAPKTATAAKSRATAVNGRAAKATGAAKATKATKAKATAKRASAKAAARKGSIPAAPRGGSDAAGTRSAAGAGSVTSAAPAPRVSSGATAGPERADTAASGGDIPAAGPPANDAPAPDPGTTGPGGGTAGGGTTASDGATTPTTSGGTTATQPVTTTKAKKPKKPKRPSQPAQGSKSANAPRIAGAKAQGSAATGVAKSTDATGKQPKPDATTGALVDGAATAPASGPVTGGGADTGGNGQAGQGAQNGAAQDTSGGTPKPQSLGDTGDLDASTGGNGAGNGKG